MARKKELEAGRKKLEEFRRNKAAKVANNAKTVSQLHASDGDAAVPEEKPSETDNARLIDSNGAGTSDALAEGLLVHSGVVASNAEKESDIALRSDFSSSNSTDAKSSFLRNSNDPTSSLLEISYTNNGCADDKYQQRKDDDDGLSFQVVSGVGNDHFLTLQTLSIQENGHVPSHSNYHGLDRHPPNNGDGREKDLSRGNFSSSTVYSEDMLFRNSASYPLQDKLSYIGRDNNSLTSSLRQEFVHSMPNASDSLFGNVNSSPPWSSDLRHTDYSSDSRSSSNYAPPSPPGAGRRSRPSFLDSIQIPKGPSSLPLPFQEAKVDSSGSKAYLMDGLGSSVSQRSVSSSVTSGDGINLFNHVKEDKHDFFSQKQNEDFAALEQHIEDLTQEKFSLQRDVEASRALAENLASENSALTDSFNQQGSVINELKFDLEKLNEEIKAQLAENEAVRIEYANAQLECDAADQRANILASELIALEEKSLKVRSNELKLERQLESSQAEISSYRKKLLSLEKDCQDLQSTAGALKEEKKLLQSKLRKASASGNSINTSKTSYSNKDVSTSTDDLGVNSADINTTTESSNLENFHTSLLGDDVPSSMFTHENISLSFESQPLSVPSDQLRMIQNINTLMAELALEKDQLMQALSEESSQSSKLLELNKELTRKLESQTQRLELLTTQRMANDNIQARQPDPLTRHENTTYADEGDEVVERVLGWIMKLFPGGSSRRRTL